MSKPLKVGTFLSCNIFSTGISYLLIAISGVVSTHLLVEVDIPTTIDLYYNSIVGAG